MRPDALAQEVARVLAPVVAGLVPELDVAAIASLLEPPPKPEMGDLAFPCFRLSKPLKQAPPKIAQTLAEALREQVGQGLIAGLEPAGPYLNLRLVPAEVGRILLPAWARGERPEYAATPATVMVEYSQPNTHKAFHVGHMRNLCLGDSLVRLLRTTGYRVVAANYLGDVGTHVAKCLWGLEALAVGDPPAQARGEWLGEVYSRAAIQLEDWEKSGKAGDGEAAAKYAAARERMTTILHGIETRDPVWRELWERTRQWSLDEFEEIYAWCGVHFDRVFYESEVDEPGLALVDEFLAKGVFAESQGAIGIHNPEIKHMPFFMLRKSDGTGLYATKDLALARKKFEEYGIDRSIYVVDARQSDHFKQVFLTLKKMGFPQAERCEHVAYEMVELPSGAMSSRAGTVILFRALREQLAAALERRHFASLRDTMSEQEIRLAIHQVSLGAIKYGMLVRDNNQKIVFDMDKWTEIGGGDSGPTIQYVAARSASLLRKAGERELTLDPALLGDDARLAAHAFAEPAEQALLQAIAALPNTVAHAAQTLRPSMVCAQLYALAKAYNHFQQTCDVIHQADPAIVQARLLLVAATRSALSWGLELLGIPAPERM
ncbi:arginine--tRNA ligase [Nannocystaceae bacterium ST9]